MTTTRLGAFSKVSFRPQLSSVTWAIVAGRGAAESVIFMNYAPESLTHASFDPAEFVATVRGGGLRPDQIVIEISERLIEDTAAVVERATELRALLPELKAQITNDMQVVNSQYNISGKAIDSANISNVFVSLNGGAYQAASLTNDPAVAVKTWGLSGAEIDKGVDGPYEAAVHFQFESLEAMGAAMGSPDTATIGASGAVFAILIVTMLVRPQGVFGQPPLQKV